MTPDNPASGAPLLDIRRRRLLFRATHRGTHETDLLIGDYVVEHIAGFDEAALDALEDLMELPDVDLAEWLTGRSPIPPEADTPMLQNMRAAALRRAAMRREARI